METLFVCLYDKAENGIVNKKMAASFP